jgi:hypothetical protein
MGDEAAKMVAMIEFARRLVYAQHDLEQQLMASTLAVPAVKLES